MIRDLEDLMYTMSDFFLAPVLILLVLVFAYSLMTLGELACQYWQRRKNSENYLRALGAEGKGGAGDSLKGYPLVSLAQGNPTLSRDELDVAAMEEMEGVRLVSRIAPMLGLIATMVPMGPALKSLADGDIQGISENLIVAFSAVIFGLVTASITFWVASVRKRWLAAELVALGKRMEREQARRKREVELHEVA